IQFSQYFRQNLFAVYCSRVKRRQNKNLRQHRLNQQQAEIIHPTPTVNEQYAFDLAIPNWELFEKLNEKVKE
ncbi:hypothetical protein, partial [Kingella kingae]|uniref:hypothetical protein n=1 Tax=Kingella kingae TaxID=504 RepID=UPI0025516079